MSGASSPPGFGPQGLDAIYHRRSRGDGPEHIFLKEGGRQGDDVAVEVAGGAGAVGDVPARPPQQASLEEAGAQRGNALV